MEVMRSVRIPEFDAEEAAVELDESFWNVPRISTRWFSSALSVSGWPERRTPPADVPEVPAAPGVPIPACDCVDGGVVGYVLVGGVVVDGGVVVGGVDVGGVVVVGGVDVGGVDVGGVVVVGGVDVGGVDVGGVVVVGGVDVGGVDVGDVVVGDVVLGEPVMPGAPGDAVPIVGFARTNDGAAVVVPAAEVAPA